MIFYIGLLFAGYNAIPEKRINNDTVKPVKTSAQALEENKKFTVQYKTEKQIMIENSSYIISKRQIFVAFLLSFLTGCLATYFISVKALAYLYKISYDKYTKEIQAQYREALKNK